MVLFFYFHPFLISSLFSAFTTLFCAYLALRAIACGVSINGLLPTCSTTCIPLGTVVISTGGRKSRGLSYGGVVSGGGGIGKNDGMFNLGT